MTGLLHPSVEVCYAIANKALAMLCIAGADATRAALLKQPY
jgi:hypothetical protein